MRWGNYRQGRDPAEITRGKGDGKSSDWYSGAVGEDHARCDNDASTYDSFGEVGVKLEFVKQMRAVKYRD